MCEESVLGTEGVFVGFEGEQEDVEVGEVGGEGEEGLVGGGLDHGFGLVGE